MRSLFNHDGPLARLVLIAALALASAPPAVAQRLVTEVIPIGYRPVEELLPIIRPLVPPPGGVSGIYDKIVIKSTPENIAEVKAVIAELAGPPRNLLITVSDDIQGYTRQHDARLFGSARSGDVVVSSGRKPDPSAGGIIIRGDQGGGQLSQQESGAQLDGQKRVRVLEGREAFISTGQSILLSHDYGTRYVDASSGFYVRARVTGDSVRLDISPRRSAFNADDGTIEFQDVATSVSGRTGEWIPIAGVDSSTRRDTKELTAASSNIGISSSTVFLKVDVLAR